MSTKVIVGALWKVSRAYRARDKNRCLSRNIIDIIVRISTLSVFRNCLFFEFVSC